MRKPILSLGKALNKADQKQVNGGYPQQDCEYPAYSCISMFGQQICCYPEN